MVYDSETIGGAIEDIRAFCAVLEQGTISGAARHLGESKGSISRRISRLEQRLNAVLLTRTPRAVSVTEEGIAFYTKARDALELLDDGIRGAMASRAVPQGHLRVTAPHDLGLDVLPDLIACFRDRHPQITVELLLTDASLDLARDRVDLALRASGGGLPDMAYRATPIMDLQIGLYAAPDYLANHGAPASPAELQQHIIVANWERRRGSEHLNLTGPRGRYTEVTVNPAVHVSDYAGVHRLLLAGMGVGPLPDAVAAGSVAAERLLPVLPQWTLMRARLYGISVSGRQAPARVRVFLDFIRAELAQQRGNA